MQLPDLSLLVIMALFWATYAVLRAWVFRPLGAILDERETTTASATSALSAVLQKEKETLAEIDRRLTEARREVGAARQAARAEANAKRAQILEAAREKARAASDVAQAKLEGEIAAARADLANGAKDLAEEVAAGALGRRIA